MQQESFSSLVLFSLHLHALGRNEKLKNFIFKLSKGNTSVANLRQCFFQITQL